jgi:short-chain Z-isoprenyl diphosphate synthase
VRLPHPLYGLYERRLAASLPRTQVPRHVGVILDGNRRWARNVGESAATGHRRGADKISELLTWSEEIGVEVVTLWMLSTDNLSREPEELESLLAIIEDAVRDLAATRRWCVQVVGSLDLLPPATAAALLVAQESTRDIKGLHVNVAVGYGGRREIADAVRAMLREHAEAGTSLDDVIEEFDVEHIADHLYTKGQPDPRAAAGRLPAVAERALRVLLLRGVLAGLPAGRLPACRALVRRARAPSRALTASVV